MGFFDRLFGRRGRKGRSLGHKNRGKSFFSFLGKAAKSVVGAIPFVGSFAKEGIEAAEQGRKFDAAKAAAGSARSIPFVGSAIGQGIDDLRQGRRYQFGKALRDTAIDTATSLVPGGRLVRAGAKVAGGALKRRLR